MRATSLFAQCGYPVDRSITSDASGPHAKRSIPGPAPVEKIQQWLTPLQHLEGLGHSAAAPRAVRLRWGDLREG